MSRPLVNGFLRLLLGLYFPFLVALCALLAWLIFELLQNRTSFDLCLPLFPVVLGVLGLMLAQILWASRVLFMRLKEKNEMEIKLSRKKFQPVHDWVAHIAREQELRHPGEIRVTGDNIAYVYESAAGVETLVLGGVAVTAFSQEALAGIVAHELAHLSAGDTRLSRRGHRRALLMAYLEYQFARQRISNFNPLVWLVRLYHLLFRISWAAHSRQQEFAADAHSCARSGAEATAAALIHLHVTERLPWVRLSSIAESYVKANEPLRDLFAEQVRRAKTVDRSDWEDACKKEMSQPTGLFDSHPALKDRLKAVGVSPKKALKLASENKGAPARDLFQNWADIEKELTERVINVFRQTYQAKMEIGQILRGGPGGR